eukprot:7322881-Pyramimonas_sp.AAC.1
MLKTAHPPSVKFSRTVSSEIINTEGISGETPGPPYRHASQRDTGGQPMEPPARIPNILARIPNA